MRPKTFSITPGKNYALFLAVGYIVYSSVIPHQATGAWLAYGFLASFVYLITSLMDETS